MAMASRWGVLLLLATLISGAGPVERGLLGGMRAAAGHCLDCHAPPEDGHTHAWLGSAHARSGIVCLSCHGGDGQGSTEETAHAPSAGFHAPPATPRQVITLCRRCHTTIAAAFETSRHYQVLERHGHAPTCITCHDAAGATVLAPDAVESVCARCHHPDECGGSTDVPHKARRLLEDLHEVILARALIGERLLSLHGDRRTLEARLHAIDRMHTQPAVAWHRFDVDAVAQELRREKDALAKIKDTIEEEETTR